MPRSPTSRRPGAPPKATSPTPVSVPRTVRRPALASWPELLRGGRDARASLVADIGEHCVDAARVRDNPPRLGANRLLAVAKCLRRVGVDVEFEPAGARGDEA